MNNEIEALNRNNTWTICDLPKGRKPVESKWLFKNNYKSTGEIERYKVRLVVKGFSQREGFDYVETFSPVVKMSTVRCMLNVAVCNNYDLFQLDINNAFLYGDLTEDVYMSLPPGFDNQQGTQSKFDYYLFTKKFGYVFVALFVYVDDIVITGNNLSEIGKFKVFLKSKFKIKDLGKLKYFLGIEVLDNADDVCLRQELLEYIGVHVNDASESSKPSWGKTLLCKHEKSVADLLHVPSNRYSPRPNLEDRLSYIKVSESVQDMNIGLRGSGFRNFTKKESMKKAFQDMLHELGGS
ncbi:ribonuclease H-like domain-containing protein [Tanacetum coccineum]